MGIKTTVEHAGTTYAGEVGTIKNTFLGIEDHGILTFTLEFLFNGVGQGTPSYFCDRSPKLALAVRAILDVLGAESWEKLRGMTAVALYPEGQTSMGSRIVGIANVNTGRAFVFTEVFDG